MKDELHMIAVRLANAILGPSKCPICEKELRGFWYLGGNIRAYLKWNGVEYEFKRNLSWDIAIKRAFYRREFWHDDGPGSTDPLCEFDDASLVSLVKDLVPEEVRAR